MKRHLCVLCGQPLGDGSECRVCDMYLSDMEARQEDSALRNHYESGRWLMEPMP